MQEALCQNIDPLLAEKEQNLVLLRNLNRMFFSEQLQELDLSWCEEVGCEDEASLEEMVSVCTSLRKLLLRQCRISEVRTRFNVHVFWFEKKKYDSDCGEVIDILFLFQMAMRNLCDNCGQLRQLNVSSVNCITDSLLVTMSMRLRQLTILDISWNCGKKDKILKPLRALDDPNKCSL